MPETTITNAPSPMTQMYALRGEFTDVTYFMTSISLADCVNQLHFAPADEADSFAERVQRRIDTRRADKIFTDYLQQEGPRFFNSLVVVLMPHSETSTGYYRFTPFKDQSGNDVGDLGLLEVLTSISRIVVDGQHRLRALQKANEYSREPSYNKALGLAEMKIPIVFLTFNDIDGEYDEGKRVDGQTREVAGHARKVFIDLNKTAKRVDKNTLLILDDDDFSAVSARYLIEHNQNLEIYTKWSDRGSTLADADPFFTNIYLLDQFVQDIITVEKERQISNEYQLSRDDDRRRAINEHLLSQGGENEGLVPIRMIESFFDQLQFFHQWKDSIQKVLSGAPAKQPRPTHTTLDQRKAIRGLHQEHLLSTVAGQRAAFTAILRSYRAFDDPPEQGWDQALARLDMIHRRGIYGRRNRLWLDLLVRAGNRMRVNAVSASASVLGCLVRGESADHMLPYINPENGLGTHNTASHYDDALRLLEQ